MKDYRCRNRPGAIAWDSGDHDKLGQGCFKSAGVIVFLH